MNDGRKLVLLGHDERQALSDALSASGLLAFTLRMLLDKSLDKRVVHLLNTVEQKPQLRLMHRGQHFHEAPEDLRF